MSLNVVILAGHAGTGKTTIGHEWLSKLPGKWAWLDKDILCEHLSGALMQELTGNRLDRDSPVFKTKVRPLEYENMAKNAKTQLELGYNVMLCAPYGKEYKNPENYLNFLHSWDVPVQTVWCHVPEEEAKRRIIARNHPMDVYKLAHWREHADKRYIPQWAARRDEVFLLNTMLQEQQSQAFTWLQRRLKVLHQNFVQVG